MTDVIWSSLLELKNLLGSCDRKNFSVQVEYIGNTFRIRVGVAEEGQTPKIHFTFGDEGITPDLVFCWDEAFTLTSPSGVTSCAEHQFIHLYLPYCFSSLRAYKLGRAIGISHFAQSLDGKIATPGGQSKWISPDEDLVHCHRMRALCDGILIGMNTLRYDKPRLNVRHVTGRSPVRIIVGNSSASFSSLMQSNEKIMLFTASPVKVLQGVEQVPVPENGNVPAFVMRSLFKLGIHSVFIEGGSRTTSAFLQNRMLDEVQLFVAPQVFGSGLTGFSLPEIESVDEAVGFAWHEFLPMGKGMFFRGGIDRKLKPEMDHQ